MSFQWIIDRAEQFSIERKKIVATTTARDGIVRAVSRGTPPKIISVTVPDGIRWTELRSDIIAAEALDRISTATISIPFAKFPWYYNNIQPAQNESYTVRCIEFPSWSIFALNQVGWSGPFVFVEVTS
jgi:hypothetical protein